MEWLGQQLSAKCLVVGEPLAEDMGIGREEDHRNRLGAGIGAEQVKELDAIDTRHLDIQNDDLRLFAPNTGMCLAAMGAAIGHERGILQHIADQIDNRGLVVHDDNLGSGRVGGQSRRGAITFWHGVDLLHRFDAQRLAVLPTRRALLCLHDYIPAV